MFGDTSRRHSLAARPRPGQQPLRDEEARELDLVGGRRDTELVSSVSVEQTLAALADPTRLVIVERLSESPASVTELAAAFPYSLRGVLKHVQVLEDAGVVRTEKQGRVRRCQLQPDRLADAARWLDDVRNRWERRLDHLEQYLQNKTEET